MKRFIYDELVKWKHSTSRKPLILNGARQVGKTYILKEFGKKEYESVAYISCDNNPALKNVFFDFDIKRIIRDLSALSDTNILPGKTLIILDEIQEFPLALTSLKYFCENAPEYHIAVAGSLLGLHVHAGSGYPVGKVDKLEIYPLSFEEFLLALGKDRLLEVMREDDLEKTRSLDTMFVNILREYYLVGGMPEVVQTYITNKDVTALRDIQEKILYGYHEDFSKHVPKTLLPKVTMVWNSLCAQLSKENKKFKYSELKKGGRAKEFEDAIEWLVNAGLVYKVNKVARMDHPLSFYEDHSSFKLFMLDLGLYGAKAKSSPSEVLIGNNVFKEYKGAFTEQYVLEQMISLGIKPYYYTNRNSTQEIDFVIEKDGKVYPIEVKAEGNINSNSLRSVMKDNDLIAYKFSMLPYQKSERIINVPLYLISSFLLDK